MDYKDRPLDQRMELATQYALLLVADNKITSEIIGIIKSDYALTEQQAVQAVGAMRANYKNEYNSNVRNNFLKALGALGFSLMAFLFYYFIGKEMGSAGTLFIILAVLFGLGGVGALLGMGSIIGDKFSKPAVVTEKVITSKPKQVDSFTKTLYSWTAICGFILCFLGYQYFFGVGVVDETKITTIYNCIITEPVRKERTSEKNPRSYYVFKFRGNNLEYRFFNNYYKYSDGAFRVSKLMTWDTVSIQVMNKDLNLLRNKYSTEELDIVNLGLHNRFLINHSSRNTQIIKSQKNIFYVCLAIFVVLVATIFLNMGTKDPYRG